MYILYYNIGISQDNKYHNNIKYIILIYIIIIFLYCNIIYL